MNNINLSFNKLDFEKYLTLIHPTGGTKSSYLAILNKLKFNDIFNSFSINEIISKFEKQIKCNEFKLFLLRSPSYTKNGFVSALKSKIIEFFNFIENNNGTLSTDEKISKNDFTNFNRKITIKSINNKIVVLSSSKIKDYVKNKNKYTCQINDDNECRYFADTNNKNYVEVHHIIPLNNQQKFKKINLDVE
ncbi:hypothetical protein FACS189496_2340 [Bacilli bacterium]|nr:hypothetical protein FACS189496_2340 [Bacilli bacterium]